MTSLTYLCIDLGAIVLPFVFSFHRSLRFHKYFLPFVKANLLVSFIYILWDALFTRFGVWSFNDKYTTGLELFGLPMEEILFFICIPFACVFTFYCSYKWKVISWHPGFEHGFIQVLSGTLMLIGLINYHLLYTSITFISTALIILSLKYLIRIDWLPQFFTVYLLLLVPFFIVNGLLTGTGLSEPVVRYNDLENLGLRLFTIPIEDVVYGLSLILLNVFVFIRFAGFDFSTSSAIPSPSVKRG